MFDSLLKDIQYQIRTGGFWMRIILVQVVVFIFINIIKGYYSFTQSSSSEDYQVIVHALSVSSNFFEIAWRPWTLLTHMFLQEGFWHLVWNCLAIFWFGTIVEDLIGKRHAKIVFFESALLGVVFFVLSAYVLPWYRGQTLYAQGSSAAVCGMLFAAATLAPDYSIRLLLLGNVPIKYIALAVLLLDILFASQQNNSGGHFAHIGGSFWGWAYISLLRKGVPMDFFANEKQMKIKPNRLPITRSFIPKANLPVGEKDPQRKLDAILEKIKISGLEKLTEEEKQFLEKLSKQ